MTHLTLWGRLSSANVQKVAWLLDELELAYDHVPLGGRFGGLDLSNYAELNPNRLVPTLRDGETIVWESHAIVRYLAATYASGLIWPVETSERAIVDQWTDWTATTFQPAWIDVFWKVVRTPEERQDQQAIAAAIARTEALLAIMDRRLAYAHYLGGEQLSYADIVAGVAMYRWTTMQIPHREHPHVAAWYARLALRKAYQQRVCVSYEELRGRQDF